MMIAYTCPTPIVNSVQQDSSWLRMMIWRRRGGAVWGGWRLRNSRGGWGRAARCCWGQSSEVTGNADAPEVHDEDEEQQQKDKNRFRWWDLVVWVWGWRVKSEEVHDDVLVFLFEVWKKAASVMPIDTKKPSSYANFWIMMIIINLGVLLATWIQRTYIIGDFLCRQNQQDKDCAGMKCTKENGLYHTRSRCMIPSNDNDNEEIYGSHPHSMKLHCYQQTCRQWWRCWCGWWWA